jgi:predicted alpha/beta superfamily hydrolase
MGDGPVRASLFGTQQHELFCRRRGRSYALSVVLPEDYYASDKRYPAVYVLDGDTLFGMAASLTIAATWSQEAPELIAVGIGYGVDSYDQWGGTARARPRPAGHDDPRRVRLGEQAATRPVPADPARGHRPVCRSHLPDLA